MARKDERTAEEIIVDDKKAHPENYFESSKGHPKDRVIINESPSIPKEGVFMSLNGYAFLAKPGVEIDLPRPILRMLDTRIETMTIQDPETKKEYHKDVPRITYRIVREDVEGVMEKKAESTERPTAAPAEKENWDK